MDSRCRRHGEALRSQARRSRARRGLRQGVLGQGPDQGLSRPRGLRPRYLGYALMHCEPEVAGRLHLGNAVKLPFPDRSFKALLSLNTVHNLDRGECIIALREIERLAPGRAFVQVDSYRNAEQKALFEEWVLTAKFHDYPDGWVALFREAGYTGDYYWTIIE